MRFAEAVKKMAEGKKMVNDICDKIHYWFDKEQGKFVMEEKNNSLWSPNALFDEDELETDSWRCEGTIETTVSGHDLVIKNFDEIGEDDKNELFRVLDKYRE